MDSIVSTALSEICSQGTSGVSIEDLWLRLQNPISSSGLNLCNGVKTAIWNGLINIPGLHFNSQNSSFTSSSSSSSDSTIPSFEQAEKLNFKIIAAKHLRDCFVGLYDVKASDAGLSQPQVKVLETLAKARTNGITQSQLAKELGMKGNNIFYVVRNLEVRGLIVRQSTIVRTKENVVEGENGLPNTSIMNTNLIHLHRYAKHLSSQQRLEITKYDTLDTLKNVNGGTPTCDGYDGGVKDDVLVKDYLPAMKAICDKLEEADGKVLVVSDIKQALGYRKTQGHRAWRNIFNRLKDAHLVEQFHAEVNKKVVSCLRLLKKFDPKYVQPKNSGFASDDFETDEPLKCGQRGQTLDQLLELPLEHQIYDLIDAEGTKGITIHEVCKRLDLNNKRHYNRLLTMFSRFGMQLQAESHNRSMHYRVWTSRNFPTGPANVLSARPGDLHSMRTTNDMGLHEKADQTIHLIESSASKKEFGSPDKMEYRQKGTEPHNSSPQKGSNQMLICGIDPHDLGYNVIDTDCDEEQDSLSMLSESVTAPSETPPSTSSNPLKCRSYRRHPCLALTAESAQREQRILNQLQEEKFILRVELHRWLESLEKDKRTAMDKKTLTRTLKKLEQEGHCRRQMVSVPLVTNCGRSRVTEVVLHNSLQSLPPELLSQIQERLRSFDMQSRGQGLARLKHDKKVPVMANIDRTLNRDSADSQAVRAEAMRANGFVTAKMVRAKLLHNFLWGYLRGSPDWDDALYSQRHGYDLQNPHSTCKLFTLVLAIKAMPLELFLQVIGATQKFEDLVENCKLGLCLADLPLPEYTSLMDNQATKRLSSLVDILCRLKLIRLVTDKHVEDSEKTSLAIFTYAMELKPYVEEPLSRVSLSLGSNSLDFRPRIRHDFILSNREAVDVYWKTLEYCYATADPKTAVHAFPGSSVPEVYLCRSWASVRVMTADQRAELLKRIVRDDLDKKITFSDCVKIARDLNLTLEQVLRVSQDRSQSRLNRFQNELNSNKNMESVTSNFISASRKRKKSSKARSRKRNGHEKRSLCITDAEDHGICLDTFDEDGQEKAAEDSGPEEEREESYSFLESFSRLKPSRAPKFLWSETSDKQLVIEYAKNRAALGSKFHRTDWGSLPDLPAPPDTCRRRMQMLNHNLVVRGAVMRLCTLLGERYARHLAESQQKQPLSHKISGQIAQDSPEVVGPNKILFKNPGDIQDSSSNEQQWDDFEDQNVKMALDEVLRCKQMAKMEVSRRSRPATLNDSPDKYLAARAYDSQDEPLSIPSMTTGEETQSHDGRRQRRSSCHRLPGKFLKLLNEGISVTRRAYESLAVANGVELLKLVFLSTSSAPEVPKLLAETLRRYSEHDLFAAFNYLREKRFMVGGNGSQPFILSQQFMHNVSSSPFPINTGKRAAKFGNWLREREQDLMEDTINLNEDLQCGDIFHLLALVSSGVLFISPCLPDEGIGEVEENSNKIITDNDEVCNANNAKSIKSSMAKEGEVVSRRAKGFPGIRVSVSRITLSKSEALELFTNENIQGRPSRTDTDDKINSSYMGTGSSPSPSGSFGSLLDLTADRTPWRAMTNYGNQLLSKFADEDMMSALKPVLFETAHSTIYEAGDQGLSLKQISEVLSLQGDRTVEFVVDVLQVFGVAAKVNAYNGVRIVDTSFRSKYFLTTIEGHYQGLKMAPCMKSSRKSNQSCLAFPQEYHRAAETTTGIEDVHKVTLLNLPEDVSQLSNQVKNCNEDVRCEELMQVEGAASEGHLVRENFKTSVDSHSFRPILPWINGDGTTNPNIYKGLVRRVLGIVMQNPGILEDGVIHRMDVLNPQSCRKLLELMILDNHLIVRKMHQTVSSGPPSILGSLCGSNFKKANSICREHLFANPLSTTLL
ncbi:B-block binding subunit of tfiiic [Thalictrum thalictroides]|uniref:B-block binding subunit of tfiiic n=1 Tax=Thalictrum thalictroides TaxID=46969 RepID=A0A7J6WVX0_THATH|nr:B-block binding subunit of tfiiic [Thalictrum thalictroides]